MSGGGGGGRGAEMLSPVLRGRRSLGWVSLSSAATAALDDAQGSDAEDDAEAKPDNPPCGRAAGAARRSDSGAALDRLAAASAALDARVDAHAARLLCAEARLADAAQAVRTRALRVGGGASPRDRKLSSSIWSSGSEPGSFDGTEQRREMLKEARFLSVIVSAWRRGSRGGWGVLHVLVLVHVGSIEAQCPFSQVWMQF